MKAFLIPASSTTPHLILLFAGWSMDFHPFEHIHPQGYDLCVVWDYRSAELLLQNGEMTFEGMLSQYAEITVFAWSFGVPSASKFIADNPQLPITAKIAVNGTQRPVDDRLGIPEAIFTGTLEGLSEKSLAKFHLRMAGSGSAYREFAKHIPERGIEELKEELIAIRDTETPIIQWDKAIIFDNDRIIPPTNQQSAWVKEAYELIHYDGAHLPNFKTLFSQILNDKSLVRRRFSNASTTYDSYAVVQRQIAERLIGLWNPDRECHYDSLEIGCGTGYTTRLIQSTAYHNSLRLWDLTISDEFRTEFISSTSIPKACDAEVEIRLLGDSSLDVIVSASTIQWFNSLPEFFIQVERVLRKGGKAIISTFGPDTMSEINTTLGKRSPYPTITTLRRMIPKGLAVCELIEETITMSFHNPIEALRHIQLTGVNALSDNASPSAVRTLIRDYPIDHQGKATLTYQPIYIVLEKS